MRRPVGPCPDVRHVFEGDRAGFDGPEGAQELAISRLVDDFQPFALKTRVEDSQLGGSVDRRD
jgi:hypothetical protein